jgi:hypothetical protein
MYHYTYMITVKNPTDARRLYIGVRSCKVPPEQDTYYGSCRPFRRWQKEHGVDGLHKQILAVWKSRDDALSHEVLLHDCFDVATNQEFWNQAKQKTEMFDTTGVSPWNKGIPLSPEQRDFLRRVNLGNTHRRGSTHTEEANEKNRLAHIGKAYHVTPHTQETKDKISATKKGKRSSPAGEFKKGSIPWNKGRTPSEETRRKISETLKMRHMQRNQNVENCH